MKKTIITLILMALAAGCRGHKTVVSESAMVDSAMMRVLSAEILSRWVAVSVKEVNLDSIEIVAVSDSAARRIAQVKVRRARVVVRDSATAVVKGAVMSQDSIEVKREQVMHTSEGDAKNYEKRERWYLLMLGILAGLLIFIFLLYGFFLKHKD